MSTWLRKCLAPPALEDEDKAIVASLLNTIALGVLPLLMVSAVYYTLVAGPKIPLRAALLSVPTLAALATLFLIRRERVKAASLLFSCVTWAHVVSLAYVCGGIGGVLFPTVVLVIIVVGLLLGGRAAVRMAGLSILAGLGLTCVELGGLLPSFHPLPLEAWVHRSLDLVSVAVLLYLAHRTISKSLQRVRRNEQALAEANVYLETSRAVLKLRTRDLERRARYLQTTAEVARHVTSVLDLQELLTRVVTLVSERFGLYHAGVYLLDESGEWNVLRAASSEGGQRMLACGHRLRVGAAGIVDYVTRTGKPCVAPEIGKETAMMDSPDLPETRSEMVLPLQARGKTMGVLDVCSTEPEAFSNEDMAVLQTLADSLATAIEQACLFQSVMQQGKRLRALTARLAEAEEAERQRLARDLHDLVGQNLNALGINLNLVRAHMPEEIPELVRSRLDDSLALVQETAASIRRVMDDLRPPMLDDFGLVATLHWYGAQFASRTGVAVTVRGEEPVPRLAAPVENALFRVVQEGLTNVAKHARASQVTVTVAADDGAVRLVVADDGVGFEPAQVAAPNRQGGWGLVTMAERAEAVGGRFRLKSQPQQGTRIIVEVAP
jgi:signal transduction histidine kinase